MPSPRSSLREELRAGSLMLDAAMGTALLADADAIWLESATTAAQALSAVRAAHASPLPIVITCAMRKAPLDELRAAGAIAAGYNCSPWPDDPSGADVLKPDASGLSPQ